MSYTTFLSLAHILFFSVGTFQIDQTDLFTVPGRILFILNSKSLNTVSSLKFPFILFYSVAQIHPSIVSSLQKLS